MKDVKYSATDWKNGVTRLNAKNMNNIEQGILYLYKYGLELSQVEAGTGIELEKSTLDGELRISQSLRFVREEPEELEEGAIYYVLDDNDNLRKIIIEGETIDVVQSDWKDVDKCSQAYIKNKPTIPDSIMLSDENVLTISGQSFLLTPKPKDYYIGWFPGSAEEFEGLDNDTVLDYTTGYMVNTHPVYENEFGENSLFFMLYRECCMPDEVIFTSSGEEMKQNFPEDSTVHHSKITIENRNFRYNVWGISHPGYAEFDPHDSIKIMYSLKPQDYYIGWVNMSRESFYELTDEEILNIVSGYNIRLTPSYSGKFGDNSLFFLMYQEDKAPQEVIFTSGSLAMNQRFPGGSTVDHRDVVIGEDPYDPEKTYDIGAKVSHGGFIWRAIESMITGEWDPDKWTKIDEERVYKIWGISHPGYATFDPKDSILINFIK